MKRFFALLTALLLLLCVPASAVTVVEPNELFYVYDGASVLSDDTAATIVLNNDALYDACGAQIVFVTIGSSGTTALSDYAYKLFNDWGIGSKDKNNGILLVMAIDDDDYYYITGKGLEDTFPVEDLAEMVNTYLEPNFAAKDYDGGANALFEQIFEHMRDIYGVNLAFVEYSASDLDSGSASSTDSTYTENSGDGEPYDHDGGEYYYERTSFAPLIVFILVIVLIAVFGTRRRRYRSANYAGATFIHHTFFRPRPPRPPRPPMGGGPNPGGPRPGGFGGSRPNVGGGPSRSSFGGSRSSFGGSRSSFSGGSRSSFGGSRSSFGGGSRSGGGGGSRGAGGGRGR